MYSGEAGSREPLPADVPSAAEAEVGASSRTPRGVLHDHELLHGDPLPLPSRVALRAGPLTVTLEAGDLRRIRLEGREVLNRIYGAVRDATWGTVPGTLSDYSVNAGEDQFSASYTSEHRIGDGLFVWRATIRGGPDGTIAFHFEGRAVAGFERNRIGLCVLHPLRESVGQHATALLPSGASRPVRFPVHVSACQPMRGFEGLSGLRWGVAPDRDAELTFEGDVFESEDQRNWIDASFKTFGTPLSQPRPVWIPAGTIVEQRVTLRLHDTRSGERSGSSPPRRSEGGSEPVPIRHAPPVARLGLTVAPEAHAGGHIRYLRQLRPAHLRTVLRLDGDWQADLASATALATALGCELELHLEISPHAGNALECLAATLPWTAPVARVLVFAADGPATTDAALEAARRVLGVRLAAPLGSGSRLDLYELHEHVPPLGDVTCWGMQPQAHATDLTSIAETPVAAGHQVCAVKRRRPGPVAIAPLQFSRGRHDRRQRSIFGAAWTLATLLEVIRYGADSVTALETIGDAGVVSRRSGVHPAYHVVADLCELSAALAVPLECGGDVYAARLRRGRSESLLAANLGRDTAWIAWPEGFDAGVVRVLDEHSGRRAMAAPEEFRRDLADAPRGGLALAPFATLRADAR